MKKRLPVPGLLILFMLQAQPVSAASPASGLPGSMVQPTVLFGLIVILIGSIVLGLSVAALNHSRKV